MILARHLSYNFENDTGPRYKAGDDLLCSHTINSDHSILVCLRECWSPLSVHVDWSISMNRAPSWRLDTKAHDIQPSCMNYTADVQITRCWFIWMVVRLWRLCQAIPSVIDMLRSIFTSLLCCFQSNLFPAANFKRSAHFNPLQWTL
jgi:hypothetical protein